MLYTLYGTPFGHFSATGMWSSARRPVPRGSPPCRIFPRQRACLWIPCRRGPSSFHVLEAHIVIVVDVVKPDNLVPACIGASLAAQGRALAALLTLFALAQNFPMATLVRAFSLVFSLVFTLVFSLVFSCGFPRLKMLTIMISR